MDWQLKIKLVAMINESKTIEDRIELRNFISNNLKDFDQQSFGIVIRALDLSTNHLKEDLNFVKTFRRNLKKININQFSSSEKEKIQQFYTNTKLINSIT